ncbi:MAG: AbrB/MazE/SpoVT family DNA-binding domain-containing protein [Deltaproteobacteria bacterium]|nr:AbrB/MazE/SpoVT family DNA-binding domain-containing protein [Deltaproteobacteria bacterium]MDE0341767.1 AbrB/MazE/SpoVT family DNA-binding domain-containing protein [Deltaproteobacteria bacterium]
MAKVTSKLQVTVPKMLADRYDIQPGDEIRFEEAGDVIRIVPLSTETPEEGLDVSERLALFDAATKRQEERETRSSKPPHPRNRGWTREALYRRGMPD